MATITSDSLTALILTYNEEDNIDRVLMRLQWLERVIVLDSYSTDATLEIIEKYPNVEVFFRKFDTHATQWNYGLSLVKSDWVLTLDADYVLPDEFIEETKEFIQTSEKSAYFSQFRFLVFGRSILGDNTTPRPVLFKLDQCIYYDDGHTQRLKITGETGYYKSFIYHDDRKPLSRWLKNMDGYAILECKKLLNPHDPTINSFTNRIRRTKILGPIFIFFYCLFIKGLIFSGWAGWHYTLQRTLAEIIFSLRLVEAEKLSKYNPQTKVKQDIVKV
ncbi:glycosyltransferase family 2 protein [Sabulibacter ruber]|uniref:glycosyltransferase family 2 protein n=1 Tax=Sabulibacter ruber TaxID=2811901 RepID=UPI001A963C4C|nr:glycosyltransferase family 2 protein [Sabulibacter ruber]